VLGVGGAVLLLVNPPDGVPAITASDARALWLAETQQRTDMGPLPGALRTWRPMLTTDLARIGPPAVAAAAAECGLGSSLVLPFDVDGDRVGVLQVLGEVQRPVRPRTPRCCARCSTSSAPGSPTSARSGASALPIRSPRARPRPRRRRPAR
jgi:hypothetical protein